MEWHNGEDCYLCDCCGVCISLPQASITRLTDIINSRAEPANDPLTLDEQREMDGEPVWCTGETRFGTPFEGWKVLEKYNQSPVVIRFTDGSAWPAAKYGVTLFVYRRKPEGGARDEKELRNMCARDMSSCS